MTAPTTVHVRVRNANNTYLATFKGLRASCTSGAEQAVKVLAHKVFPDRAAGVEFVSSDGQYEVWRIAGAGGG